MKAELSLAPHQLEGLACNTLWYSRIPEWMLHSQVGASFCQQPTYPPKSHPPPNWEFLKLFLLFGEETIPSGPINRIITVGGPHPHRAALLTCLIFKKTNAIVRLTKLPTQSFRCTNPFKLQKSLRNPVQDSYSALGFRFSKKLTSKFQKKVGDKEDWNPFYPCFFFGDSIFMLVLMHPQLVQ